MLARMEDSEKSLTSEDYNGLFRPVLKVYKVGSRRILDLKNHSDMGQTIKQLDVDFIPVRRINGYKVVISYEESSKPANFPPASPIPPAKRSRDTTEVSNIPPPQPSNLSISKHF